MGWLTANGYAPLYRKVFTIQAAQISGAPTNIPLALVVASDTDLRDDARADAHDLAITKADGTTELNYERVAWNNGTGALEIWFKAPDPESGDDYYLYYGDADQAADRQNATGVWDVNYKMVQHMGGASALALDDSTSNNNDIDTEVGDPAYQQPGQVGYGVILDGDDYVEIAAETFTASLGTIEFWIKTSSDTGFVLGSADTATLLYYMGARVHGGKLGVQQRNNDVPDLVKGDTDLDNGVWHRCVVVSNGAAYLLYVDGGIEGLNVASGANTGDWFGDTPNRDVATIGTHHRSDTENFVTGTVDEIWVSDTNRSSDYVIITHNNQVSPASGGTFWSALGGEETTTTSTSTTTTSTSTTTTSSTSTSTSTTTTSTSTTTTTSTSTTSSTSTSTSTTTTSTSTTTTTSTTTSTSTTTTTSTSTSTTTSTTTSTSTSTSTTTTLASSGGNAFGEQNPTQGETAVSWQTFSDGAGGVPTIIGDATWGKLQLSGGEKGHSGVYDFGNENNRYHTLEEDRYGTGQEDATLYIRGQATAFTQDQGEPPDWAEYTGGAWKTWRFMQIKAEK